MFGAYRIDISYPFGRGSWDRSLHKASVRRGFWTPQEACLLSVTLHGLTSPVSIIVGWYALHLSDKTPWLRPLQTTRTFTSCNKKPTGRMGSTCAHQALVHFYAFLRAPFPLLASSSSGQHSGCSCPGINNVQQKELLFPQTLPLSTLRLYFHFVQHLVHTHPSTSHWKGKGCPSSS